MIKWSSAHAGAPAFLHSFILNNTDALMYSYIVTIAVSVAFTGASSNFSAVFNF